MWAHDDWSLNRNLLFDSKTATTVHPFPLVAQCEEVFIQSASQRSAIRTKTAQIAPFRPTLTTPPLIQLNRHPDDATGILHKSVAQQQSTRRNALIPVGPLIPLDPKLIPLIPCGSGWSPMVSCWFTLCPVRLRPRQHSVCRLLALTVFARLHYSWQLVLQPVPRQPPWPARAQPREAGLL